MKKRVLLLETTVQDLQKEKAGHEKALRYLFQKVEELILTQQTSEINRLQDIHGSSNGS